MLTRRTLLQGVLSLAALGPLARAGLSGEKGDLGPAPVRFESAVEISILVHGRVVQSCVVRPDAHTCTPEHTDEELFRGYAQHYYGHDVEIQSRRIMWPVEPDSSSPA